MQKKCAGLLDRTGYPAAHTQEHAWQVLTETVRSHHYGMHTANFNRRRGGPTGHHIVPPSCAAPVPHKASFALSSPQHHSWLKVGLLPLHTKQGQA